MTGAQPNFCNHFSKISFLGAEMGAEMGAGLPENGVGNK